MLGLSSFPSPFPACSVTTDRRTARPICAGLGIPLSTPDALGQAAETPPETHAKCHPFPGQGEPIVIWQAMMQCAICKQGENRPGEAIVTLERAAAEGAEVEAQWFAA